MFAFGEGGSKRTLAGIIFGIGMAVRAVNFLSWLFWCGASGAGRRCGAEPSAHGAGRGAAALPAGRDARGRGVERDGLARGGRHGLRRLPRGATLARRLTGESPEHPTARLNLGETEARPVLRLPDEYTAGGPVGGIFSEMPFAMDRHAAGRVHAAAVPDRRGYYRPRAGPLRSPELAAGEARPTLKPRSTRFSRADACTPRCSAGSPSPGSPPSTGRLVYRDPLRPGDRNGFRQHGGAMGQRNRPVPGNGLS